MEKILIVEDDIVTAFECKKRINEFGYDVAGIIDNGEDAIKSIQKLKPDLILMDIGLNGKLDGIETSIKISRTHKIPFVFMTANSEKSLTDRAMAAHPYGYLFKPLSDRELHVAIELAFYKFRMEKRLKDNEDALRKKECLQQSIFDASPAIMCILDTNCNVINGNKKFKEVSGWDENHSSTASQLGDILKCIYSFSSPLGCGKGDKCSVCVLRNLLTNTLEQNTSFKNLEHQLTSALSGKNKDITFLASTSIITLDGNKSILLTLVDITDRKGMEISLKASEQKFRTVFETMGEGLATNELIFDEDDKIIDFRILDINPAFEKITGMTHNQACGQTATRLYEVSSDFISAFWEKSFGQSEIIEIELYSKKINKWLHISVSQPVNNMFISSFIDISCRIKNEIELKNKNILLEKLNTEKDKFFSIIAHDLKSPFQGFIGMTEMMSKHLTSFSIDELDIFSKEMHVNAKNLFDLLKNLLEWSTLQRGDFKLELKEILLSAVIANALKSIEQYAQQKNIQIVTDQLKDYNVIADPTLLNSVFINVFTNAIKFSYRGNMVSLSVAELDNDCIEVSIADKGIGMSTDMIGKLFSIEEKNGRKGTEGEPSSGLGLILCREFIEKMNGCIWAESKEDIGTVFHFTLRTTGKQS